MEQKVKLLPQGINDFGQVRRENLYYVDKTMYIDKIEKDSHFMLIVRPRRFGKSLFISMLEHYYDIKDKENFDTHRLTRLTTKCSAFQKTRCVIW